MAITINVKHTGAALQAELEPIPQRITNGVRRGVTQVVRAVEHDYTEELTRRAGGMYWPMDSVSIPTADGARGIVRVTPSRPHVIEPRDKKFLRFEIDGHVIYTKHVDHPGSNPPDVDLEIHAGRYESIIEGEVGQVFGLTASAMPVGI